jgi:hypothetical protein
MAQITPMFAVPMVSRHLEDCAALNAELEALFLAREAEGDRYRHPEPLVESRGLFESNFRLFDWPHDCVRRLRDFCWSTLYGAIGDLNGYDDPTLLRLQMADESWFHITRGGGYFELLLFPSWLQHDVLPYEGNTHRIRVAFNARFAMAGVEPRQVPLG